MWKIPKMPVHSNQEFEQEQAKRRTKIVLQEQ